MMQYINLLNSELGCFENYEKNEPFIQKLMSEKIKTPKDTTLYNFFQTLIINKDNEPESTISKIMNDLKKYKKEERDKILNKKFIPFSNLTHKEQLTPEVRNTLDYMGRK